jgi:hypothetical protein
VGAIRPTRDGADAEGGKRDRSRMKRTATAEFISVNWPWPTVVGP